VVKRSVAIRAALLFCLAVAAPCGAQSGPESFSYGAEWRFLRSGQVTLDFTAGRTILNLKTVGLVSTLISVEDRYTADYGEGFCAKSLLLDAREGRKHRETRVAYDGEYRRASMTERDLKNGKVLAKKDMEIPACVHEVTGALMRLRSVKPEPGATLEWPVSDGKKLISARVDALVREKVKTPAGQFDTIKYEAFLFNGQLYRRKGRLFVWLTDDERRMPVQFRIQLPFYIGTVTLQLEKFQEANKEQ
jgi:hypothetical protein